ncbi:MAG: hypothetical protein COZ06_28310 [Armatimonadetes bacterium CG_4_10_14_3_um_filter_66_18]|nr:hypothetical protein [Armatimonadota bacterium]NCO93825.1 hypothetical protein [Armatimonadota bacterium]PIU91243.1 MAG: hypothetical protein COS65_22540 [Armatimonadetes bacterium CG06_land_8_20_14_3_00_66_21]PIX45379.1 MAG: hypothetical protein COZ57_15625 [Armatimonadetes bacterium CG_4_8_14_3_um_filter_66_20]PIY40325.1 MAG: hypothetical protein COZ06_28310 [Armatimonadetes bacterium CG_4_10_14_3_um_filter_66_18]
MTLATTELILERLLCARRSIPKGANTMLVHVAFLIAVLTTGVAAEAPLRSASVFVEAEEFGPLSQVWRAGARWADDIYSPTSGDAVLANDGGGTDEVAKTVEVPTAGAYNVWVRYLRIGEYKGSFGLRIAQNEQTVFNEKYRTRPKGAGWEPTWEKFPATLQAGPATLTLYIDEPGIRQRIDCLLLTSRLDYGEKTPPDYHDFAPQVFFRYQFHEPAVPTTAEVQSYVRRGPVYYHNLGWTTQTGLGTGGDPIPAGEWSPWCALTKVVDTDKFLATVHLHFRSGGEPVAEAKVDFQVNSVAAEAGAHTLHEDLDGDIVTLLIPGNLARYPDLLELASTNTRRHVENARGLKLPPIKAPRPEGIKLETQICGFGGMYNSKRMLAEEMEVGSLLGANSFADLVGVNRQVAAEQGVRRTFLNQWIPYQALPCPCNPGNPRLIEDFYVKAAEKIRRDDPDALTVAYRNKLYDEPGTGNLDHIAQCANCSSAFREYLRRQELTPQDFGKQDWTEVNVLKRDAATDPPSRRLYYWSVQFRDESVMRVFKLGTEMSEKHLGDGILTNANFTNGGLSDWAGGLIDGPDWFLFGRERAQSLMWSEDWTSMGPEGTGYPVDVLRSAGSPHNLPVGMYLISYNAETLPLRTYSALMHGAKILNFYCYGPWYAFCDGSVSESLPAQKALAAVTREVARAEDLLRDANTPPAQVAVSFFKSHEIWQQDTAIQVERRNTYLALTHENYPVDFLDEALVEKGKLSGYRVFYLVDSDLSRKAAAAIKTWVTGGGTLVTCAGAGLRDEYDEELDTLKDLLSVASLEVTKPKRGYRERYDLPAYQPTDTVTCSAPLEACQVPVMGYREALTPAAATVLATFADGKPAALRNTVGKGSVIRFGFLPALAYAKDAGPSATQVVTGYLDHERRVITAAARLANVARPVECSVPRVEANLLTSPKGAVALLANWTGQPLEKLTVTLQPSQPVKTVESLKQGKLKATRRGKVLEVTLPLATTDMLFLKP